MAIDQSKIDFTVRHEGEYTFAHWKGEYTVGTTWIRGTRVWLSPQVGYTLYGRDNYSDGADTKEDLKNMEEYRQRWEKQDFGADTTILGYWMGDDLGFRDQNLTYVIEALEDRQQDPNRGYQHMTREQIMSSWDDRLFSPAKDFDFSQLGDREYRIIVDTGTWPPDKLWILYQDMIEKTLVELRQVLQLCQQAKVKFIWV